MLRISPLTVVWARYLPTLILSLLGVAAARATHLRAGEIVAVRDATNPLRYCFTLTTYTDNVGGDAANRVQNDVEFVFGDGSRATATRRNGPAGTVISFTETSVNYYDVCHTFPGQGAYTIGATIPNRNGGVINIPNSVQVTFYVATTVFINAGLGPNRTPVLRNPPLDKACTGQRFIHNPAAFDADGDSVAYRLSTSRQGTASGGGVAIPGYQNPLAIAPGSQNEAKNGLAALTINPTLGDLVWDAPGRAGQYNIAFEILEYRNGQLISAIIRDMQIIVEDCQNRRPTLIIPNDTCVVAGFRFNNVLIRATSPDNHPIALTSDTTTSGIYGSGFPPPLASFTPPRGAAPQPSPASGRFSWQTACVHIRAQPYQVLFKAETFPPPQRGTRLVDQKTWRIRVVGPAPTGLTATANPASRAVTLTWQTYSCPLPGAEMLIWRRVGCGGPAVDLCATGRPVAAGYQVVGRVPIGTTSFTDNNQGRGLERGLGYAYRLSVGFAPPAGGDSYASPEACAELPLRVPVITNVSVERTNVLPARDGQIRVAWTRPAALDVAQFPGPYAYRLFRSPGLAGTAYAPVTGLLAADLSGAVNDTTYLDSPLETRNTSYRYRLEFYYTQGGTATRLDTTSSASSVRLDSLPRVGGIELNWAALVPWSNDNQTHRVYREVRGRPGVWNQIAAVAVTGPGSYRYLDDGQDRFLADGNQRVVLSADSLYCYRVETVGSYGSARIRPTLLINRSQEICATPADTVRPCTPVLAIDSLVCRDYYNNETAPSAAECAGAPYQNQLSWTYPARRPDGQRCKTVVSYRLYYTRYEGEEFALLTTVRGVGGGLPPLAYLHGGLGSYAGCYYVTAVDGSGNESQRSNVVCKDNCPYYELPNVFTPNGDGLNEVFAPLRCPQFVENVGVEMYNRWGKRVFASQGNVLINWDGRSGVAGEALGRELAGWTYYYVARVKFARLRRSDEQQTIKGWVEIIK